MVYVPSCVPFTIRFKVDFIHLPSPLSLPLSSSSSSSPLASLSALMSAGGVGGEMLLSNDIIAEDCSFSGLPLHLNVPGYLGYSSPTAAAASSSSLRHVFDTFRLRSFVAHELTHFDLDDEWNYVRIRIGNGASRPMNIYKSPINQSINQSINNHNK